MLPAVDLGGRWLGGKPRKGGPRHLQANAATNAGEQTMTKPGMKIDRVVSVAAIWCAVIVGGAPAQISDPEQAKSWFFLQKIAKDIEELDRCMSIVAADLDLSAIALEPYGTAYNKKVELFTDEADAYVHTLRAVPKAATEEGAGSRAAGRDNFRAAARHGRADRRARALDHLSRGGRVERHGHPERRWRNRQFRWIVQGIITERRRHR
jgi:hypothetical protein